jgi:hypothetical protein
MEAREEAVREDEIGLGRAPDDERVAFAEVLERLTDRGRDAKAKRWRAHLG